MLHDGFLRSRLPVPGVSSLIVGLNLVTLIGIGIVLVLVNPFQASVLTSKVENLTTQGKIIASALSDVIDMVDIGCAERPNSPDLAFDHMSRFPINPEVAFPVLRRLVSPMEGRARIYDCEGRIIVDSDTLFSEIILQDPPPGVAEILDEDDSLMPVEWFDTIFRFLNADRSLEAYTEHANDQGLLYPEVSAAISGKTLVNQTLTDRYERVITVGVPIDFDGKVIAALQISTPKGLIDEVILRGWRLLAYVLFLAGLALLILSYVMSRIIALPLVRLAEDARRVIISSRRNLPGNLRSASSYAEVRSLSHDLNTMTGKLYERISAIETFAADVAHELKNPLSSLRSATEMLLETSSSSEQTQLLEIVDHSSQRLNKLITEISNASRLDAELLKDDLEIVDLRALLKPFTHQEMLVEPTKEARLVLSADDSCGQQVPVLGNEQKLAQVFYNLFNNAKSFAPPGSEIKVLMLIVDQNATVRIEVQDQGPGIPGPEYQRIFERFYTDRPQSGNKNQNSGLGLTISRQIIEAYRGTIRAENRIEIQPGGSEKILGASFILELPLVRLTTS